MVTLCFHEYDIINYVCTLIRKWNKSEIQLFTVAVTVTTSQDVAITLCLVAQSSWIIVRHKPGSLRDGTDKRIQIFSQFICVRDSVTDVRYTSKVLKERWLGLVSITSGSYLFKFVLLILLFLCCVKNASLCGNFVRVLFSLMSKLMSYFKKLQCENNCMENKQNLRRR